MDPFTLLLPGKHSTQLSADTNPIEAENRPAGQCTQRAVEVEGLYLPLVQSLHAVDDVGSLPAGQVAMSSMVKAMSFQEPPHNNDHGNPAPVGLAESESLLPL